MENRKTQILRLESGARGSAMKLGSSALIQGLSLALPKEQDKATGGDNREAFGNRKIQPGPKGAHLLLTRGILQ